MKVGTVCYSISRGLGHLAKGFHDHGIVTDVCVVRHRGVPERTDWYPGSPRVNIREGQDRDIVYSMAKGMDAMLFFETPFDWGLIQYCKEVGVRTYLITMYECTPIHHDKPYRYICPSLLDMQYFKEDSIFIPLPVEYLWKLRTHALEFVHNGGYLGLRGREGTTLLIEAMQFVKSPIKLTIRVQENVGEHYQKLMAKDKRIEYIAGTIPYEELYATGDVVVQPQKFNGCSLPLQEARASGMLVMSTDRFPMNTWLPKEPLIPVSRFNKARIGGPYLEFDEAQIRPDDIAQTIDNWYGKEISDYSHSAKEWAKSMSWEALGTQYKEILAE